MAVPTRLELATSAVTGRRANQLRHETAGSEGRIRTYIEQVNSLLHYRYATSEHMYGGGRRIRTSVGKKPIDLQSTPFNRFGIPPMVHPGRVELPLPFGNKGLNLARLPIPPRMHCGERARNRT